MIAAAVVLLGALTPVFTSEAPPMGTRVLEGLGPSPRTLVATRTWTQTLAATPPSLHIALQTRERKPQTCKP